MSKLLPMVGGLKTPWPRLFNWACVAPVVPPLSSNTTPAQKKEDEGMTNCPGASYYVKLSALGDGHDAGNYFLGVDFNTDVATAITTFGSNTLHQSSPLDVHAVSVTKNRLYEFILSANNGPSGQPAIVTMQIFDLWGNLVFSLTATAGQPASTGHVYLKAGKYVVKLSSPDAAPPIDYSLTGRLISDPIGPRTDDGSGGDPSTTPWDGSTGTSSDPSWDQPYYW